MLRTPRAPAAVPSLPAAQGRILGLDLARLIATLGVIWFHTGYSAYNVLGYFRMPFYAALLAYLAAGGVASNRRRTFLEFARHRAMRLLVPFAIWLVLFRVPNLMRGHLSLPVTWNNILAGMGAVHLWFLPFAFCASLVAYALARGVHGHHGRRRAGLIAAVFLAGLALSAIPLEFTETGTVLASWTPLAGPVTLGVGIALLLEWDQAREFVARRWFIWWLLFPLFSLLSMMTQPGGGNLCGILGGVFLLLAGMTTPMQRWPAFWKYCGQLCYGMYLTHFAFVLGLERIRFVGEGTAGMRFAIILTGSVLCAVALQHLPGGRLLLGIEPASRKKASVAPRVARRAPAPAMASV